MVVVVVIESAIGKVIVVVQPVIGTGIMSDVVVVVTAKPNGDVLVGIVTKTGVAELGIAI